jgi:hypothetical protein
MMARGWGFVSAASRYVEATDTPAMQPAMTVSLLVIASLVDAQDFSLVHYATRSNTTRKGGGITSGA